jgi:S-DNA-T family DNA segregation ATPase FtsK/SpoIIIE
VGEVYNILLLGLIGVGLYLIIKRKQPNYFSAKMLGLYLLLIVILIWCHLDYFSEFKSIEFGTALKDSWNDIWEFISNPS